MESHESVALLAKVPRGDESAEVRRVAAWALGQIEERAAGAPLAAVPRSRRRSGGRPPR